MVALPRERERKFTVKEYLTLEREADFKSEYYCGRIYAMAGASPRHNHIAASILRHLGNALEGSNCVPYAGDLRIRTTSEGLFSYPDATVVCGQLEYHDERQDVVTNPTLIIEVLSPSTEEYDRGIKGDAYALIPSLKEYVLVWQDKPRVEIRTRQAESHWLVYTTEDMDSVVEIKSIGHSLSLKQIYAGIDFSKPEHDVESQK